MLLVCTVPSQHSEAGVLGGGKTRVDIQAHVSVGRAVIQHMVIILQTLKALRVFYTSSLVSRHIERLTVTADIVRAEI